MDQRVRSRQEAFPRQGDAPRVRLSTRSAGVRDDNGAGAGGGFVCENGRSVVA
jgi:hypothetical protein